MPCEYDIISSISNYKWNCTYKASVSTSPVPILRIIATGSRVQRAESVEIGQAELTHQVVPQRMLSRCNACDCQAIISTPK